MWTRRIALLGVLLASCRLFAQTAPAGPDAPHSRWYTLGTNGGPVARPDRSEPANLLTYGKERILVDCGDGAAEQLAKVNIPVRAVTAVVLSHLHFDHTGGLLAVLGMRYQALPPPVLTIYGPPGTKATVDGLLAAMGPESESGAGIPGQPYRPPAATVNVIEISDGDKVNLGPIAVTVRVNTHYSYPPGSEESRKYQSLSFRFDAPDRSLVYTGDTGPSANVDELAKNADILFSEVLDPAITIEGIRKQAPGLPAPMLKVLTQHMIEQHMSAEAVGRLAKKANVKEVVLIHTSREEGVAAIPIISAIYPGKVIAAKDLEVF